MRLFALLFPGNPKEDFRFYWQYDFHVKYLGYRLRRKPGIMLKKAEMPSLLNTDNLVHAFALTLKILQKKYSLDKIVIIETRPCLITFSTLAIEKVLFMFLS